MLKGRAIRISYGVFWAACMCAMVPMFAQATQCWDQDGQKIEIPEKMKLVLIPHWVNPEKIIFPLKIAKDPKARDTPIQECDPDSLAVSPSVCED